MQGWRIFNKSRERTVDDVCQKPFRNVILGRQGGITVSGGEALFTRFLIAPLTKAKEKESKILDSLLCLCSVINHVISKFNKPMVTDLVLLIKEINEEQHKIVTSRNQ